MIFLPCYIYSAFLLHRTLYVSSKYMWSTFNILLGYLSWSIKWSFKLKKKKKKSCFSIQFYKWQCGNVTESKFPYSSPITDRQLDPCSRVICFGCWPKPLCNHLQTSCPHLENQPVQTWLVSNRGKLCYGTHPQSPGIPLWGLLMSNAINNTSYRTKACLLLTACILNNSVWTIIIVLYFCDDSSE